MNAIWTGLAPSSASQPPSATIRTTAAETSRSAMTMTRASCDDALRRFGCTMTTRSSSAMFGATIALGASGMRRSAPSDRLRLRAAACGPSWHGRASLDRLRADADGLRRRRGGGRGRAHVGRDRRVERAALLAGRDRGGVLGGLGAGVLAGARPGAAAPGGTLRVDRAADGGAGPAGPARARPAGVQRTGGGAPGGAGPA